MVYVHGAVCAVFVPAVVRILRTSYAGATTASDTGT